MNEELLSTLPYFTQNKWQRKVIADKVGVLYAYGSSNLIYRNVRLAFGVGNQAKTWLNGNDVNAADAFKNGTQTASEYFMNLRNLDSGYMQHFK